MAISEVKNEAKWRQDADRFFEQANFPQALRCYKMLDSNPEISERIKSCTCQLLRKYWRQGKPDEFARLIQERGWASQLQLALARLKGPESIQQLLSSLPESEQNLGLCALRAEKDLKGALLDLRHAAEYKDIAEGWLALLKGDPGKAQTSFSQAKMPLQAQIGKGISCLVQGDFLQASELLQPLRPFAMRRFPTLAKAMGWDDQQQGEMQKLPYYLFSASLEELKAAEKKLLPSQKKLQGWIWLRIGDHLYEQRYAFHAVCDAWKRAEKCHPELHLDVLKRRFLLSRFEQDLLDPNVEFASFYKALQGRRDAQNFLEYLLSTAVWPRIISSLTVRDDTKWLIDPPEPFIQLLWLHLYDVQNLNMLVRPLFLKNIAPELYTGYTWNDWEALFSHLDPLFSSRQTYLQAKSTVAQVFAKDEILRKTLIQQLQCDHLMKEELFTRYIKLALSKVFKKKADAQDLAKEIEPLKALFPHDFDLIRLQIITSKELKPWHEQASAFSIHLSQPLYLVLRLQLMIDEGRKLAACRPLMLPKELFGKDREADWRFFAALCSKRLQFPKNELVQLFAALAHTDDLKHLFLSKLEQYGESAAPLSLLKWYEKRNWEDGCPQYHIAMHYVYHNKFHESIDWLMRALRGLSPDSPEIQRVKDTLDHVFAMAHDDEDFII